MSEQEEMIMLQQQLNSHIEKEEAKWKYLIAVQEGNTASINKLLDTMERQIVSTEGLVEAWRAASALHRFIKWAAPFVAMIVAAIAWFSAKNQG